MQLTQTTIETLRPAIEHTWMMIYPDVDHTYMEDNVCRMEMVLDSDRLHFAGYAAENALVRKLCMEIDWRTVRDELAEKIQLAA